MAVRILYDEKEEQAALYDSVTGWAFGPVFDDSANVRDDYDPPIVDARDLAERFLAHLAEIGWRDARRLEPETLNGAYNRWRAMIAPEERT
jgi:hypothetical protein